MAGDPLGCRPRDLWRADGVVETGELMGISQKKLQASLDALAVIEPRFADAISATGYPEERIREPGYATLLRTIVGQQVSVAAAASVWNKLEALLGEGCPPDKLTEQEFDALRACGLSRQKQGYARSLAELVMTGALPLDALPADDEEAIAYLTKSKASAAGRRKSICSSPKAEPTSGPQATSPCRKASGVC